MNSKQEDRSNKLEDYPSFMQVNAEDAYKEQASYFKALSRYYEHELEHMRNFVEDGASKHFIHAALSRKGFNRKLDFKQCRTGPKVYTECTAKERAYVNQAKEQSALDELHTKMPNYPHPSPRTSWKTFHVEVGEPGNGSFVQMFTMREGDTLKRDSAGCFVYNTLPSKRYEGIILNYLILSETRGQKSVTLGNGDFLVVQNGELEVVHFSEVSPQMEIPLGSPEPATPLTNAALREALFKGLVVAKCEGKVVANSPEVSSTYPTHNSDTEQVELPLSRNSKELSDSILDNCIEKDALQRAFGGGNIPESSYKGKSSLPLMNGEIHLEPGDALMSDGKGGVTIIKHADIIVDDAVTVDHGYTELCCDEGTSALSEDIADLPVGVTNILHPKNWGF